MATELIWIFWLIYGTVLLAALCLTRSEQLRNGIPWKTACFGLVGCFLWPFVVLAVLVALALQQLRLIRG